MSVETKTKAAPATTKARVLVVDDLETNRSLFFAQLERKGYVPDLALDGAHALEMIAQNPYDIVLLDIMMPGLDGIEVLKVIRQTHTAAALPVVMVTARTESASLAKSLELGANDYVTKPIDMVVLIARMETQLARGRGEFQAREEREEMNQRYLQREKELAYLKDNLGAERQKREALEIGLQRTSEQGQAAIRTRTRVMTNMSQELRTPLNEIIGFSDLIRAELARKEATNSSEYANYIGESSRRVLSLIDQVAALSDIEAGQVMRADQVFSAADLIKNTTVLMAAEAGFRGVELRASFVAPDASIYGDWAHVERALVNLIAAVVKLSDPGGTVDIRAEVRENGDTTISIANEGSGLTKDELAALLEPFGRLQGRAPPGDRREVDLDIPLAKSLIEFHGGSLEIETESTPGLMLKVVFPRAPSAAAPA